ncbi:MAG: tRNA preQ1(34) S-adenosylmethionine ribosyltransferase-isomerase QueA [Zetaproteobacteria bacterium]|nr:tRNA preQ1(34) S-adenosylmethionine ribosyltransferase-isomerase QueA [Zetaproteobacteria bacterium]
MLEKSQNHLSLEDFDYCLPSECIAQQPLERRSSSKMLVWDPLQSSATEACTRDLQDFLQPGTVLVLNNTKVFPSRFVGRLSNLGKSAKVELFLLGSPFSTPEKSGVCWTHALGKPVRKIVPGAQICFAEGLQATVVEKKEDHTGAPVLSLQWNCAELDLLDWAAKNGQMPLPPYIRRDPTDACLREVDTLRYQTEYAKHQGSVAAPTAGLHFTKGQLEQMRAAGVEIAEVTLHVGAGTFMPVKTSDIAAHFMHEEVYQIPAASWRKVTAAKQQGRRVICVGTTSFRCVESFAKQVVEAGHALESTVDCDRWHKTRLFVFPRSQADRFNPRVVDGLFTNFHQPKSTLFMLVCALIGYTEAQSLYQQALAHDFRFLSYGDACLLSW